MIEKTPQSWQIALKWRSTLKWTCCGDFQSMSNRFSCATHAFKVETDIGCYSDQFFFSSGPSKPEKPHFFLIWLKIATKYIIMVSITDLQRLRNTSLSVRMIKTIEFEEERWWIDSKGMVPSWTFNRKDEKFWLNRFTWRPICSVFRLLSKNDATDFNLPHSFAFIYFILSFSI